MRYIFIILLLAGCTDGYLDLRKSAELDFDPPPGPKIYQKGWKDGCISGYGAQVDSFYKTFGGYGFRQDLELKDNKMYHQVWRDAFWYCAFMADVMRDQGF